jgi:YfiH family protein
MNNKKSLNYIEVFKNGQCIAGFTLLNASYRNPLAKFEGLNLGLNNLEDQTIVIENRDKFFQSIDIQLDQVASLKQIHSNKVLFVNQTGIQKEEADAMITSDAEICLLIQIADCTPILMYDPKKKLLAAIHAGWRGAINGIVVNTLQKLASLGCKFDTLQVAVGPCIGVKNFEVGYEVAMQFPNEFVDNSFGNKPHINLRAFIIDQLISQGICFSNVTDIDICTVDNIESCYSHRRQGISAGRMGAFIKLKE